ncbi:MAG TPA: HAD-IA family hydrolase [Chloroflexota bacterium]|nr:HAD-IA family hydrolase [Chloroflexota bacterium]
MMKYTAVIFDRDGVLTDFDLQGAAAYFESLLPLSVPELAGRWQQWGATVGFPGNKAEEAAFWQGFWQGLAEELKLPPPVLTQLQQVEYTRFMRPFPDARGALLAVRQLGLQTGVLSIFTLASLADSLTAVGLADLIDEACAATVIGVAKPHSEAYLTICRALGVSPAHCLFFDDEALCVQGARAVGMQAYLVDRQRHDHDLDAGIVCDLTAVPLLLSSI